MALRRPGDGSRQKKAKMESFFLEIDSNDGDVFMRLQYQEYLMIVFTTFIHVN